MQRSPNTPRDRHTLLFFELEWAEARRRAGRANCSADDRLASPPPPAHARRYRPHLLTEPERSVLTEKAITGRGASSGCSTSRSRASRRPRAASRTTLEAALGRLHVPDREVRAHGGRGGHRGARAGSAHPRVRPQHAARRQGGRRPAAALSAAGSRARNLSNEASDESVQALVDAVQGRYSIPQRWYTLKARLLGLDRIADYDRMASVADVESADRMGRGKDLVLDATARSRASSADTARRSSTALDRRAAPARQAPRRVLRVHGAVAPPVRVAELDVAPARRAHPGARARPRPARLPRARAGRLPPDARRSRWPRPRRCSARRSTFGRLLEAVTDSAERLALLASNLEDQIATVFRQIAMNRFEDAMHTARREEGELSVERFGELWAASQARCSATRSRSPTATAPGGRTSRTSSHAGLRLRVRVRPAARAVGVRALRGGGRRDFVPALPRSAARRRFDAARGARRRSSASTSPTPASGTAASTSSSAASKETIAAAEAGRG